MIPVIQEVKKAELHCHVDGLLNPVLLKSLPATSEIHTLVPKLAKICPVKNFQAWAEQYCPVIYPVFENRGELLLELLSRYLYTLLKQNVIYAEIMLSSFTFQYADLAQQIELYQAYRDAADKICDGKMQVEFLIAIGRTTNRQKMEARLTRILDIAKSKLICGVAVAGLEDENTIKPYQDIFSAFKKAGLGMEIHAGEWKGPSSVWEALEYGYATRIGHGLAAFDDPLLVKYIKEHDIHLEFSPTSNVRLTKYTDIRSHPIKKALAEAISFSINTDDPGPFCTDMNTEYALVQQAFNLNEKDFEKILTNSLKAAFGKVTLKDRK